MSFIRPNNYCVTARRPTEENEETVSEWMRDNRIELPVYFSALGSKVDFTYGNKIMATKKPATTAAPVDAFVLQHYRTAIEVEQCAREREEDARLLGNVRAGDIAKMCEHYRSICEIVEPLAPIFAADGIRFWVCPSGCDASVMWNENGIATCENCFRSSKS